MYGGADYLQIQRNAVTQDIAQAGSTFKPFALVAALESGISLDSVYDGNTNKTIPGFDTPVHTFMVASVTDSQGNLYYEHQITPKRVFAEDVMADATYAMQQVVNYKGGSGH